MQIFFFSNMFLKQFNSLGADSRSTQLIFCFDLPNFVLTGRFHAVEKRPTQQLKWKVSSILLELIATASKTASQYCFIAKIWSSRHHSDSALDLPLFYRRVFLSNPLKILEIFKSLLNRCLFLSQNFAPRCLFFYRCIRSFAENFLQ